MPQDHSFAGRLAKDVSLSAIDCPMRSIRLAELAPASAWRSAPRRPWMLVRVMRGSLAGTPAVRAGTLLLLPASDELRAGPHGALLAIVLLSLRHRDGTDPLGRLRLPLRVSGTPAGDWQRLLALAGSAIHGAIWHRVQGRALALGLLADCLARAQAEAALRPAPRPPPAWQDGVERLIARRIGDPGLGVADLAAQAACSVAAFTRAWRTLTGRPPGQHLLHRRIGHAQSLLHDGCAVKSVARRCGFTSAAAFIRRFHAMTGRTPGAWARSQRG